MRIIRLAVASLNQIPLDWANNRANILAAVEDARSQKASILCLPELCISGYGCEDTFHAPFLQEKCVEELFEIAQRARGLALSVGLPILHRGSLFNTAALIVDGEVTGFVAKKHLAGDGIHYEPRWFKPWPSKTVGTVNLGGRDFPIGDLHFEISGVRVGFEICEDAWVADRAGRDLALSGVDIILNPSASHFAFGKHNVRKQFVLEGARAFNVSYAYANLIGCEAGRIIYDGDCMIASAGQLLACSQRFRLKGVNVISADIDVDLTRTNRARTSSYKPSYNNEQVCIRAGERWSFPDRSPAAEKNECREDSWETSSSVKEEEFVRSVSLGLFDYLRKSHMQGFVVSLSGGADSSAVSCLVKCMIDFAVSELGLSGFKNALGNIPALAKLDTTQEITAALLCCVYQKTRNNSEATRNSAREVATALGATFHELDIQSVVDSYVQMVSDARGAGLNWQDDDYPLQNVQARARVPGVWLLANVRQALLLCCSNRSEAAVGYATMDGDTAGGFNPIGGIDKAYLRKWLSWMEKDGPQGFSPIPALRYVNAQQPSAELRPLEMQQTDEADLMPYPVLNAVELLSIRDKKSPLEVLAILDARYAGQYSRVQLARWIERFFRLWSINQWKRERYAPSFHLDDESLDPKTWCRFPILSSGFRHELEQLKKSASDE